MHSDSRQGAGPHDGTDSAGTPAGRHQQGGAVALLLLALVYAMNVFDRFIFAVLLEPIKAEFHLSDTQMGSLAGIVFFLFYGVIAVPIAILADMYSRKWIIATCLSLFSLATFGMGLVTGYVSLVVARICVGIGEAGTTPASVSILAERFSSARRQLVMSLFTAGASAGMMLGLVIIGRALAHINWRLLFFGAGSAGLLIALLVVIVLKEPARTQPSSQRRGSITTLAEIIRIPSFCWIAFGVALFTLFVGAVQNWTPAFLGRSHGFSHADAAYFMALSGGAGGAAGAIFFGLVTSRLQHRGGSWPVFIVGVLNILVALGFAGGFFISSDNASIPLIVMSYFFVGGCQGPILATVQDLVAPHQRASAQALLFLISNSIGNGLGPLATGALSDLLRPVVGMESLRAALLVVIAVGGLGAAIMFALGAFTVERDLRRGRGSA